MAHGALAYPPNGGCCGSPIKLRKRIAFRPIADDRLNVCIGDWWLAAEDTQESVGFQNWSLHISLSRYLTRASRVPQTDQSAVIW